MYEHAMESGIRSNKVLSLIREYEDRCFTYSDFFIAVDEGQKELLISKGVSAERVQVIQNAVDVEALRSASLSSASVVSGDYFIMCRRLTPKNGTLLAVEAFLDWVGKREVRFLVAGDGHLRPELEKIVGRHHNGEKVRLLGSLNHEVLLPLLRCARASVVPSVPFEGVVEATSLSALESLALDVPVIASDIGGLAEIDGGTGLLTLVPPGSKDALIESFEYWASRDKQDMGSRLSEHVGIHFGVERWLKQHLEIYARVCLGFRLD
jgi:glycosyltransferase involved in cell wall biosynthesis